jgi:hypothetical protein
MKNNQRESRNITPKSSQILSNKRHEKLTNHARIKNQATKLNN